MDRYDVEFSHDLNTVSFDEFQQFHFVPSMSVSCAHTAATSPPRLTPSPRRRTGRLGV